VLPYNASGKRLENDGSEGIGRNIYDIADRVFKGDAYKLDTLKAGLFITKPLAPSAERGFIAVMEKMRRLYRDKNYRGRSFMYHSFYYLSVNRGLKSI